MSWYTKDASQPKFDYAKPIFAENGKQILLPRCIHAKIPTTGLSTYTIMGYDWFDLTTGIWNSARCWSTPEEAVDARDCCFNGTISVTR